MFVLSVLEAPNTKTNSVDHSEASSPSQGCCFPEQRVSFLCTSRWSSVEVLQKLQQSPQPHHQEADQWECPETWWWHHDHQSSAQSPPDLGEEALMVCIEISHVDNVRHSGTRKFKNKINSMEPQISTLSQRSVGCSWANELFAKCIINWSNQESNQYFSYGVHHYILHSFQEIHAVW